MPQLFPVNSARYGLVFWTLFGGGCSRETPPDPSESQIQAVSFAASGAALSAERGLSWKRDEGFLLANHTVPTVLEMAHETVLFTSAPERGHIAIHRSKDGLNWEAGGRIDLGALPEGCGVTALDVSVHATASGYRLIVETWLRPQGLMDPSGQAVPQEDSPTRFCALDSPDGQTWTPMDSPLDWPGLSASWPSGLEFVPQSRGEHFFYVDTYPDLDGIRFGAIENGVLVSKGQRATLLPSTHVDPAPVLLEQGGVRLYHSRSLEGVLAFSDSSDGVQFGESVPLDGLSGQVCHAPPERPSAPDKCYLDPAFLRLKDDRLVLYFSVFESLPGGVERRGIGRAYAVD